MLKKILLTLTLMIVMVAQAFATDSELGDKTTTSQPYVKTQVDLKQGLIPAAGTNSALGETVVTYTANGGGEIGERGIYSDPSSYDASADADKLITASALNTAFATLPETPTTTLECANPGTCTLWTIVDQTAYGESITLPAGYTRLAYIESNGTQYINTQIKADNTTSVEGNFYIDSGFVGQVFGSFDSGAYFRMYAPSTSVTGSVFGTASFSPNITPGDFARNSKIKIKLDASGIYIGDHTYTYSSVPTAFTATSNLYIGAISAYTSNTYYLKGRVYDFIIKKNGVLVRNFIPAKYGNEVGMYDTVSRAFFRNAGSGTFGAGPVVD